MQYSLAYNESELYPFMKDMDMVINVHSDWKCSFQAPHQINYEKKKTLLHQINSEKS